MQETWVPPLGWEYPLEKEMTTQSNILAWKISEIAAWWATAHGLQRVSHDRAHTHYGYSPSSNGLRDTDITFLPKNCPSTKYSAQFSSVQLLSHVQLFATP